MGYIEQALLQQTLCKQRQSVILPLLQHSRDCSQEHVITTTEFCEENKLCVWGRQTALHCGGTGYTRAHLPRSCDCKKHLVTKDGHCRGRLQYSVGTDTDTERERDRVRTCRYPIAIHSHSAATGWLEKHRKQNMDNIRPIKHTNTSSDNIQMTGVVFCKCPTCEWFNVIELTLAWAQRDSMLAQYYVTTQPRYSFTQATFLTDMT